MLIVHTGPLEAEIMRRRLIEYVPRIEVCVMTDGETALVNLEREPVDLVVAAVELAGFAPHGFTRELRALRPEIPVLATSAFSEHRDEAIAAGALRHIRFPDFEEIGAEVRDTLAIDEELAWRE